MSAYTVTLAFKAYYEVLFSIALQKNTASLLPTVGS